MTLQIPPPAEHRGYPYLPSFWDYYTQLPGIYHRFALSTDAAVEMLHRFRPLTGLRVLDVAAGTGRSAFAMAKHAAHVTGVEPEALMRDYAIARLRERGLANVEFLEGSTHEMPPLEPTDDLATSFHGPPFLADADDNVNRRELRELIRVLRNHLCPDGAIAFVMAIPRWRHQYLREAGISGYPSYDPERRIESALFEEGFTATDALLRLDFGTLDEALATYGYIYGPDAIDWLLARQSPVIEWGNRVYLLSRLSRTGRRLRTKD